MDNNQNTEMTSGDELVPNGKEIDTIDEPPTDIESEEKKLPYPKSVFFIVTNEFCERFSYYGMKAVLTLYLKNILNFNDDDATIIYHTFSMCCYFTPLFGAMIADSLLGKFRTIFYLSVVYCLGNIVLALAATPPINLPAVSFSMIGLALIAIGTGGIKPCVAAFGGDQFKLPEQEIQLASFFSVFYFAINSGSLLSTILTPIFREDVKCFDQDNCFSLAFSVPAALMIVSLVIFLLGKPLYTIKNPAGNVVIKIIKCIGAAISNKGKNGEKEHWLDNAEGPIYNKRFIEDVKIVLRVLVLYIPLPVFWALYDQQGSRWTLQATRMDGLTFGFTIKPDQVQVLNPILILIFIPLFDQVIYPLLGKFNLLTRPLQRLTCGLLLAAVSFVSTGIVELQLEKTYPVVLKEGRGNLHFINTLPCDVNVTLGPSENLISIIPPYKNHVFENIPSESYPLLITSIGEDPFCKKYATNENPSSININATSEKGYTVVIGANKISNKIEIVVSHEADDRDKPEEGFPKLRFFLYGEVFDKLSSLTDNMYLRIAGKGKNEFEFKKLPTNMSSLPIIPPRDVGWVSESRDDTEPTEYRLFLEVKNYKSIRISDIKLDLGGSYVATITPNYTNPGLNTSDFTNPDNYVVGLYAITTPSSLHMVWLLPQYIIMTTGEIMFSVTGLEFSYAQSPVSMKSVLQASWLLAVAFGNLIVVIIAEAKFFEEQSKEFFLFAGIMLADMFLFIFLAWRYIPAQLEDPNNDVHEIEEKDSVNNKRHDD